MGGKLTERGNEVHDDHGNAIVFSTAANPPPDSTTIRCADGRTVSYPDKQVLLDMMVVSAFNGDGRMGKAIGNAVAQAFGAPPSPPPAKSDTLELGDLPSPLPGRCAAAERQR